jgi:hypothetical protein
VSSTAYSDLLEYLEKKKSKIKIKKKYSALKGSKKALDEFWRVIWGY